MFRLCPDFTDYSVQTFGRRKEIMLSRATSYVCAPPTFVFVSGVRSIKDNCCSSLNGAMRQSMSLTKKNLKVTIHVSRMFRSIYLDEL
jgi:hypothetical protein